MNFDYMSGNEDMFNMNAPKPAPKKKVQQKQLPFTKWRKYMLIFTAVCVVLGLAVMLIRGFAWDTDFIGGTSMQINIGHELTKDEIAEITEITETIIEKKVSAVQRTGDGGSQVLIKCTEIDTEVRDAVFEALKERFGLTDADRLNVTSVGASVSADFRRAGITSVTLAVALMLVYITIRFDFRSGIAAVVCLTHDLFFMAAAYALLQLPMNSNIIAALLFAAGHLPATFAILGTSPLLIARCFLLNGGLGLLFGRLYRKYGLRYAMIAHGGCHVVSKLVWILFL